jgi:hypothetical protein
MPYMSSSRSGWKLNRINCGKPYRVELTGPYKYPQVVDSRGGAAITNNGAVFCGSTTQANRLCALANADRLEKE